MWPDHGTRSSMHRGHRHDGSATGSCRGHARTASGDGSGVRARARPRSSGIQRPIGRTRPGAGPGRPARRRPRRAPGDRSPTARGRVSPFPVTARRYSSERVTSETVRSSVDSVTATPARWRRASGWSATDGTIPAWTLLVGHRSRATPRAISSSTSAGSSIVPGPWAIRSGSTASARRTWAAPPHSPAWRVILSPPARAAVEGSLERKRIRVALLRPGQVPADEPRHPEPGGDLGQLDVERRIVRPERGADQPDDGAGPQRRLGRAAADGGDPVGERQAAPGVERRAPADLDVADPVGGLRLDQLAGDALERLGVLDEGDREVEPLEELGLATRSAPARRARRTSPAYVVGRLDVPRPGELERRVDAERAVEVEVELGLRERLDEPAQRSAAGLVHVGRRGLPVMSGGHRAGRSGARTPRDRRQSRGIHARPRGGR